VSRTGTVTGQTAHYMLPSLVGMAVPFVTLPIMTRWLTPTDYGIVAVGQIAAGMFAGLASMGVLTGVERYYFEAEHDRRRLSALLYSSWAVIGIGAMVWTLVFAAVAERISTFLLGAPHFAALIFAQCLTAIVASVGAIQNVHFRNAGRASDFMRANVTAALLESASALVGVVVLDLGVWGLVGGPLVARTLVVGGWSLRIARELPPRFEAAAGRKALAIGAPLMPRLVVGTIEGGLDRFLLGWLSSLGHAGLFALGSRVGSLVFALTTSLEQVFQPPMYRMMLEGGDDAARKIGRHLTPYIYVSITAAVVIALFIQEVLWVLVTPAFWGAKDIAVVLTAAYGQTVFGKVIGAQLIFAKRTIYATPISVVRLGLHAVLAFALIVPFGGLGAALALLITAVVVDVFAMWIAQRAFRIQYETGYVLTLLAILYAVVAWVLIVDALGVPYALDLTVRLGLLAAHAAYGRRWLTRLKEEVRAVLMPAIAAMRA
jgi:O-antigen/teichoic acid export membrane protein